MGIKKDSKKRINIIYLLLCIIAFTYWLIIPKSVFAQRIDYFPLAVGNSWTYDVGNGVATAHKVVTDKKEQEDGSIMYEIKQSNYMKGELWFKTTIGYSVDKYAITKYLIDSGSSKTILKLPVKIGDKWGKEDWLQYTIEKVKEPVIVPAGKFTNCIRVKETNTSGKESDGVVLIGYTYYAPNVGEIKMSGVQINKGKATKEITASELKEYELK